MFVLNICTLIVVMSLSCSTATNVQLVTTAGTLLRSLCYSPENNCLYGADPKEQKLYRFDLNTGDLTSVYIGCDRIDFIRPIRDHPDNVIYNIGHTLNIMEFDKPKYRRYLLSVDFGKPDTSIKDGIADGYGRLWYVTDYDSKDYNLKDYKDYKITRTSYILDYKNIFPVVAIRPYVYATSFAFYYDKIYFIDQDTRQIIAFDFFLKTGNFDNQKVIFDFNKAGISGTPIYIIVDARGNIFVAIENKIVKITYDGKLIEIIKVGFGVRSVISLAFGDPNLNTLYASCTTRSRAIIVRITGISGSTGQRGQDFVFPDADKY